jgi:hypothetical protein
MEKALSDGVGTGSIGVPDKCSGLFQIGAWLEDKSELIMLMIPLVEILGDPWHWGRAWKSLRDLSVSYAIRNELQVLDFYFLSEYLEAKNARPQNDPQLIYLDQLNVALLRAGETPKITLNVAANAHQVPLVFLMVEHCRNFEHPLFILVNIGSHEAFFIAVGGNREQPVSEEPWFQQIWKGIGKLLQWPQRHSRNPMILYSSCRTVSFWPLIWKTWVHVL